MRSIAYRVPIKVLIEGEFVKSTGEYDPNYVKYKNLKINRAQIIGTVESKFTSDNGQYIGLVIDDTTGRIRVKLFGGDTSFAKDINEGDTVRAIGKIKETDERYIQAEIVKKVGPKWLEYWKVKVIQNFDTNKDDKDINEESDKEKDEFMDIEEIEV